MNTAATLWCTAAVGTSAGLGRYEFAALGALGVLSANVILRPVAHLFNRAPAQKENHEILYRLRCTCRTADEDEHTGDADAGSQPHRIDSHRLAQRR